MFLVMTEWDNYPETLKKKKKKPLAIYPPKLNKPEMLWLNMDNSQTLV